MGVTAGASIAVVAEVCGALAKRLPTPTTAAANASENKVLRIIWLYELVVHLIGVWMIPEKLKQGETLARFWETSSAEMANLFRALGRDFWDCIRYLKQRPS